MACVMEPKTGPGGEYLEWEPTQIPSNKPFVNIATSAEEPLSTYENMNFVKTRSLVYSPFHPSARYINFEVGYSKDSKWLESINDKWNDYANFFVGGFFEATYSTNDKIYAQIDAKMIDYDVRFRHPNNRMGSPTTPTKTSANAFALKRNKATSPSGKKSAIINDARDDESNKATIDQDDLSKFMSYYKTFKKSQEQADSQSPTSVNRPKKRQLSDLCNLEESSDDHGNDLGNDPNDNASNDPIGDNPSNDPVGNNPSDNLIADNPNVSNDNDTLSDDPNSDPAPGNKFKYKKGEKDGKGGRKDEKGGNDGRGGSERGGRGRKRGKSK
jgi:hypothetical protein